LDVVSLLGQVGLHRSPKCQTGLFVVDYYWIHVHVEKLQLLLQYCCEQ